VTYLTVRPEPPPIVRSSPQEKMQRMRKVTRHGI
jgi:hypothetical protein